MLWCVSSSAATSPRPCSSAAHTAATQHCANAGARLCTLAELQTGVTRGTGCGFDRQSAWTKTTCGSGGVYRARGRDGRQSVCEQDQGKIRSFAVRCCADV